MAVAPNPCPTLNTILAPLTNGAVGVLFNVTVLHPVLCTNVLAGISVPVTRMYRTMLLALLSPNVRPTNVSVSPGDIAAV